MTSKQGFDLAVVENSEFDGVPEGDRPDKRWEVLRDLRMWKDDLEGITTKAWKREKLCCRGLSVS